MFVSGENNNPELIKAFELVQEWIRFNNVRAVEIIYEPNLDYNDRQISSVKMRMYDDFYSEISYTPESNNMLNVAELIEEENSR